MDARRDILVAVRDQARLLRDGRKETDPAAWTQQQWWESFVYLFVNGGGGFCSGAEHHDDLLFFVRASASGPPAPAHGGPAAPAPPQQQQQQQGGQGQQQRQQGGQAPAQGRAPYFVRRRGASLPDDLALSGPSFASVDWPASVLLNAVLQGRYQLTVVACGRESLAFVAEGRTWAPRMTAVARPVFASPTVTAVNLDSSRPEAASPAPCYPDACFAVDNFDAAFDELVLSEPDHCYCVVLHALLDGCGGSGGGGCGEAAAGGGIGGGCSEAPTGGASSSGGGSGAGGAPGWSPGGAEGGAGGAPLAGRMVSSDGGAPAGGLSGGAGGATRQGKQQEQEQVQVQEQEREQGQEVPGGGLLPGAPHPIRTAGGAASSSGGAAGDPSATAGAAPAQAAASSPGGWRIGTRQRCLFAGYVSYDQIVGFLAASHGPGRSILDALLAPGGGGAGGGGGGAAAPCEKVVMTGPGGVGRAEVAVTRVGPGGGGGGEDAEGGGEAGGAQQGRNRQSGGGGGGGGPFGIGGLFSRARQVAVGVSRALQAELAAGPSTGPAASASAAAGDASGAGGDMWRVQCALMLLRLPVEHLARELLDAI